jgi:DNA-directed RNA polymerase subunit RPC12/RpoP
MSQETLLSLIPLALAILFIVARAMFLKESRGSYAGMAVCRKCGRAFPRPFFAPNLVTGKLVRCSHCGAWAILPAASPAELQVAQSLNETPAAPERVTGEEPGSLRRRLEESKYE